MKISEISKKYDLSTDTLRYYERIGLIPEVPKNKSGIREYDDQSEGWINFIKCMRSAGMPIEAIIKYVTLYRQGDSTINERRRLLEEQRENLIKKCDDINTTIERLNYKIKIYDEISSGKRKSILDKTKI